MSLEVRAKEKGVYYQKTRFAILVTNFLNEPFFYIYGLLSMILRKDLEASIFQISLLTMLRPTVAILSFYWSSSVSGRKHRLRANFIIAGLLSKLPFLLFPFVENVWFYIAAGANFTLFYRAGNPAWIEIIKLNLVKTSREKLYSIGTSVGFAVGVIIAIGFGWGLDHYLYLWKYLFFWGALISLLGLYIQFQVPINGENEISDGQQERPSLKMRLMQPWTEGYRLMKTRPDFSRFQWAFMLGGFGLMLFQPALPIFFVDVLHLSYIDLSIAILICKGLGTSLSSPIWGRLMQKVSIAKMMSHILILFGLFPMILFLAPLQLFWLYLAYFIYGIANGGSHLIWNLSGPFFAGREDSSIFSGVNVVMVGLRGCIAPSIGGVICSLFGPIGAFTFGMAFCFYAGIKILFNLSQKLQSILNK